MRILRSIPKPIGFRGFQLIMLTLIFLAFASTMCTPRGASAQEPDIKTTAVCVSEPHKFVSENGDELYKCTGLDGKPTSLMGVKPNVLTYEEARLWTPTSLRPTPEPPTVMNYITESPLAGMLIAIAALFLVYIVYKIKYKDD